MNLSINVPLKSDIINGGFKIKTADADSSWSKNQLGNYANKNGVYIHHSNGEILYIGKATRGDWGTFGERLRREFQLKASGDSDLYNLLSKQDKDIYSYLLGLNDIDMMVDSGPMQLSKKRKALIMEQVLIGLYEPIGNKI